MQNKKNFFFLFSFLITINISIGQELNLGSWNIVNVKYNFNEKTSAFGEAQLRSLKFYDDFHYYEYKFGVNHKIFEGVIATFGAGSYQTYQEDGDFVIPKKNNEFRMWPQLSFVQTIGKIKIEQRYRSELRFTSNGYRNRFRYRLGFSYPFGKIKKSIKPFQISMSNEIFFTNNEPFFERNRSLAAINYRYSKSSSFQIGYLHQFDYKINDETGRDFLQIGYYYELFKK